MEEAGVGNTNFSLRELEILRLISIGLSDREIANELFLSRNTIKWYNRKIYAKLNVNNRTQAVVRTQQLNLLAGDSESQTKDNLR